MVKKLRKRWLGLFLSIACLGCSTHATGIVSPVPEGGTALQTIGGETLRLRLGRDSAPLAYLDGHEVEIEGVRSGRAVRVRDWRITGGLHGLQVWVGPVDILGIQVGIADRNTGSYFVLDEASWDVLAPFAGDTVLVEGWVEGAHRLRVVYYRVLAAEEPSGGAP
jgi:hypothetical protein